MYVEKPGSHNIFEGRKMVEAAQKYNRIVQHGVQLRSSEAIQEAVQHLRKGIIGNVYMARGLVFRWRPVDRQEGHRSPSPPYLDYDLWRGPAQERPFTPAHRPLQLALELGLRQRRRRQPGHPRDRHVPVGPRRRACPTKITAMGGKFLFDDDKETPGGPHAPLPLPRRRRR